MNNMNTALATTTGIPAYQSPASDELRAVHARFWGVCSPKWLRITAVADRRHSVQRRAWLIGLADRLEASEFETYGEVTADRFDEIAELFPGC